MTTKIDATEFLKVEAAQKVLEILSCAGLADLGEIQVGDESYAQQQASEIADQLLAAIRSQLVAQIITDAKFLAADCAFAMAGFGDE